MPQQQVIVTWPMTFSHRRPTRRRSTHACTHTHTSVFLSCKCIKSAKTAEYGGAQPHDQLTCGHLKHHTAHLKPARATKTKTPDANTLCSSYNKHGSWLVHKWLLQQECRKSTATIDCSIDASIIALYSSTVMLARDAASVAKLECEPYVLVSCQGDTRKKYIVLTTRT